MSGIHFDWSKNWNEENGEWIMDIRCPNEEHHEKYGYDWETKYESITDLQGNPCESYEGCPCCEDDSGRIDVMWNTIWPLDYDGMVTEEKRIQILKETSCALIQNLDTDEWFICLCGCGMDFSPHIAYAFYLAQKWLPTWLLSELRPGWCRMELGEKKFKTLRNIIGQQLIREQQTIKEKRINWSNSNDRLQNTTESEYSDGYYSPKISTEKRILDGMNFLNSILITPKQKRKQSKKKENN